MLTSVGCAATTRATGGQPVVHYPAAKDPAGDPATLAAGNDAFAGRMYAQLAKTKDTFAFSPFSISQAMAMTSAGARGATLTQLESALSFGLPRPRVPAAFGALNRALASRSRAGVRLSIADSLWGQQGLRFEAPFLSTLSGAYGAPLRRTDFDGDPEGGRRAINSWVADHTADRITDLLPKGSITRETRLVLANAVYLNARWAIPFKRSGTARGTFHAPAGARQVLFMHQTAALRTVRGPGFRALELPYRGDQVALDVVLPDRGRLASVEGRVARGGVLALLGGLRARRVDLALPKVKLESQFELAKPLTALGARDVFSDHADLSGMSTQASLTVSRVLHKAVLAVDERGTVAAAATGVVVVPTSIQVDPALKVTVNRPFLLVVRDRRTGAVLFLARVLDPTRS